MIPFNESSNILWGASCNPWSYARTVGSSSEAALVMSRLVNLGLAEDFMGEQRINAAINGVACFCPSPSRIPHNVALYHSSKRTKVINEYCLTPRLSITAKKVSDITLTVDSLLSTS